MPMRSVPPFQSNRPATPFRQYMNQTTAAGASQAAQGNTLGGLRQVTSQAVPNNTVAHLRLNQATRQGPPVTTDQDMRELSNEYGARYANFQARGAQNGEDPNTTLDTWIDTPMFDRYQQKQLNQYIPGVQDADMLTRDTAVGDAQIAQRAPYDAKGANPRLTAALIAQQGARAKQLDVIKSKAPITDVNDPGYKAWVAQQMAGGIPGSGPALGRYGTGTPGTPAGDTSLDAYNKARASGLIKPTTTTTAPATAAAPRQTGGITPPRAPVLPQPQLRSPPTDVMPKPLAGVGASLTGSPPTGNHAIQTDVMPTIDEGIEPAVKPIPNAAPPIQNALSGLPEPATAQTALSRISSTPRVPQTPDFNGKTRVMG